MAYETYPCLYLRHKTMFAVVELLAAEIEMLMIAEIRIVVELELAQQQFEHL